MAIPAEAPRQIGADVLPQEATNAEAAPLVDVLDLVAQEVAVGGGGAPNRDNRTDGDGVGTRRDRATHPKPMVAVPPEAHGNSQYSLAVRALR